MKAAPILVATDFSATAARAVSDVAARFPGAPLVVAHVIDAGYGARVEGATGLDAQDVQQRAWNRADVQLEETVARLRSERHGALGVLREGELAVTLAEEAARHEPWLIVLALEPCPSVEAMTWPLAAATGLPVVVLPAQSWDSEPTTPG
jgi:hypothetical protein